VAVNDTLDLVFSLLTLAVNIAVVALTVIALWAKTGDRPSELRDRTWDRVAEVALPLAFAIALTATLGSLYYSEVRNFIPCKLCWYQRIAMYPLPVLLGIAWWRRDRGIRVYAIPIAAIGAALSIYHYQLEWFPSQATAACAVDAPCTVLWLTPRPLGYISIAFMALSGFLAVIWLTWIAGQRRARES
jgi:disulfide bond formation protein DsbB